MSKDIIKISIVLCVNCGDVVRLLVFDTFSAHEFRGALIPSDLMKDIPRCRRRTLW
jgi:hypothetical protein